MCGDSDVIFPLVFNAIGLSSTLQMGPSTNPHVDQRLSSPHLIAGFITPPVHRCPNETRLDLNNGLFYPDVFLYTICLPHILQNFAIRTFVSVFDTLAFISSRLSFVEKHLAHLQEQNLPEP